MKIWAPLLAFAVAIALLPLIGNNYVIRLATIMTMYAGLALSWNFIGGMAGYPSFATAAFFGLGAYTSGILQGLGAPVVLAWPAAAAAAGVFAVLLGMAILHLKGHYFAIASLVVAEVLREVINSAEALTGGGMGLNLPIMRLSVDGQARLFLFAMLGVATALAIATVLVGRSKFGFGLRCINQNEDAASMLGVDTTRYKVMAFCLSATGVGAIGAIYASWVQYIEPPDVFDILLSVKPLVMVLLGGLGTVAGPIIGAFIYLALEEIVWRNFLTIHSGVLGVIVVGLVLFLPNGLLALRRRRPAGGGS
jgi:branched-chain amino acid transport system permease protein